MNDSLDTLVRDFTEIPPRPKSEVRSRLEALITQTLKDERDRIGKGLVDIVLDSLKRKDDSMLFDSLVKLIKHETPH